MPDILLHLLPHVVSSLLYAAMGVHFWQTRWRESGRSSVTLPMQGWERGVLLGALVIQGFGLYEGLFSAGGMRFSFSFAMSLMLWLAVLIYWLESFRSRMDGLQPMVLPLAALGALSPALFPQLRVVAHAGAWGFQLHFLTAMLAYSLFTLSALHAIFMGFAERKLHQREITRSLASLPPILTMEALLFRMITIAFCLLTLALISGVMFSEAIFGKAMALDHKTLFAFASWGIFAALLIGRRVYGWRGRVALRWTLAGFLVLLLAYMGSRFVAEVLLHRY
ncbi:cytochrome c biogenesis protein CcsA [Accumulibacter sp.]|uniref:cytochrome C assembly family protein n=1 Tax=Accumulibacter sp. TaxID=2053492 RepID=UPI001E074EDD|nr:cytochrome c biogenesis protein CcsA [Accumulibacter sp.]MCB1931060.1 cytochrome c biogenesis protein CcsA [Accumulibacter sp.]MCB1964827.1 cytochrome c biogenesis protein CcsA [Accumulibacter sp.]MCP5230127.1 cytochrome c biogenesis protein CcsA [Accumulibacter sp.]